MGSGLMSTPPTPLNPIPQRRRPDALRGSGGRLASDRTSPPVNLATARLKRFVMRSECFVYQDHMSHFYNLVAGSGAPTGNEHIID